MHMYVLKNSENGESISYNNCIVKVYMMKS
jgi:hypothetical protein